MHPSATPHAVLRLLPLLVGMIVCCTGSGIVMSKTSGYRVFPIVGSAMLTIGLLLLLQVGIGTSLLADVLYMLALGIGLGCVMQGLVLIVQSPSRTLSWGSPPQERRSSPDHNEP